MKFLLVLIVVLFAGCTSLQPVVVSKGNGLMNVSVQPKEVIQAVCQNPRALGCVPYRYDQVGITVFFVLPPDSWGLNQSTLENLVEIGTHEACHAIYQTIQRTYFALKPHLKDTVPPDLVQKFSSDPCHTEDGGRFHAK